MIENNDASAAEKRLLSAARHARDDRMKKRNRRVDDQVDMIPLEHVLSILTKPARAGAALASLLVQDGYGRALSQPRAGRSDA